MIRQLLIQRIHLVQHHTYIKSWLWQVIRSSFRLSNRTGRELWRIYYEHLWWMHYWGKIYSSLNMLYLFRFNISLLICGITNMRWSVKFPVPLTYGCKSDASGGVAVIWWRHQMETFSELMALCAGIHRSAVNSPHKGQWCGVLVFSFIYALSKRLRKRSWDWWFETPSRPLWRHCNDLILFPRAETFPAIHYTTDSFATGGNPFSLVTLHNMRNYIVHRTKS